MQFLDISIPEWLLGDIVDMGVFYNMFLGAILVIIGFFGFKYIPLSGAAKWLVCLAFIGAGIALLFGYLEVW